MWLLILAVLTAVPFGWGLGVVAAYAIAGPDFGQLPALTVPIAIIASVVFAVVPILDVRMRLRVLLVGTAGFVILGIVLAP